MHVLLSDGRKRNFTKFEKECYLHRKSVLNRTYSENVCTLVEYTENEHHPQRLLKPILKITIIFLPSIEELGKVTPSLKHTSVER